MVKRIGLYLVFFFCSLYGKSQQSIEYGLQAGLNLSSAKLPNSPDARQGILTGFNIGTQLTINRTRHFGVKAILQYEQRGFMYKNLVVEYPDNTIGKANILCRLNYIDLKILPVLTVGSNRKFYFYAGPTLGVLVGNKLITKFKDPLPPGSPETISVTGDKRKATNFGVAFGVGSRFPIAHKIQFGFDVRSDIGLSNVLRNGNAKLRTLSFSPGMLFSF